LRWRSMDWSWLAGSGTSTLADPVQLYVEVRSLTLPSRSILRWSIDE
jgi:hypothetical protein